MAGRVRAVSEVEASAEVVMVVVVMAAGGMEVAPLEAVEMAVAAVATTEMAAERRAAEAMAVECQAEAVDGAKVAHVEVVEAPEAGPPALVEAWPGVGVKVVVARVTAAAMGQGGLVVEEVEVGVMVMDGRAAVALVAAVWVAVAVVAVATEVVGWVAVARAVVPTVAAAQAMVRAELEAVAVVPEVVEEQVEGCEEVEETERVGLGVEVWAAAVTAVGAWAEEAMATACQAEAATDVVVVAKEGVVAEMEEGEETGKGRWEGVVQLERVAQPVAEAAFEATLPAPLEVSWAAAVRVGAVKEVGGGLDGAGG